MRLSPWLISGLVLCGCATLVPHKVWSHSDPGHVGPVPLAVLIGRFRHPGAEALFAVVPLASGEWNPGRCEWSGERVSVPLAELPGQEFHGLYADERRIEQLWFVDSYGQALPARIADHLRAEPDRPPLLPAIFITHVCSTKDRALLLVTKRHSADRVLVGQIDGTWRIESVTREWIE